MMNKPVKVALLEDNIHLLRDLKERVDETGLAKAIIYSTTSDEFIQKVKADREKIDILIMDIDLIGESVNGIDVAMMLKKPTLFVSGKTKEHLNGIQDINLESNFPVEFILKPVSDDKLKRILIKIIDEIKRIEKFNRLNLIAFNFDGIIKKKTQDSIVFLESITDGSNNKRIFFTDEMSIVLSDFTFSKMIEKGYDEDLFITPHQSYRVNRNHAEYDKNSYELKVWCKDENGFDIEKRIPVSENSRPKIRKIFQK